VFDPIEDTEPAPTEAEQTRLRLQRDTVQAWLNDQALGAWGTSMLDALDNELQEAGFNFFERPHCGPVQLNDGGAYSHVRLRTTWRHPDGGARFYAEVKLAAHWGLESFGILVTHTKLVSQLKPNPLLTDELWGSYWYCSSLSDEQLDALAARNLPEWEEAEQFPQWRTHVDAQVLKFTEGLALELAKAAVSKLQAFVAV
jgi:hypothetical protein